MPLIVKCYGCKKKLIFGLRTFYYHPTKDGEYLCQNCDIKYRGLRDALYLKALDKAYKGVIDGFNSYIEESIKEEEENKYPEKLDSDEVIRRINKLEEIYEKGGISKEDFEKEKSKLLNSI